MNITVTIIVLIFFTQNIVNEIIHKKNNTYQIKYS